ncbi:hypothetical protein H6F61_12430 [Cyanobacteria bacterium FACHB-472]|nr:hypothetical protein [Cyanobacteria bacterium FACHB-472]
MSTDKKIYTLKLLFDNSQVSLEDLKQKTEEVLQKFLPNDINLSVEANSTSLELIIKGELEIVDDCHDEINKRLIGESQLRCKRLLDEVGDEIRQQAYPILSAIEQRFRVFVSQALIEVSGFDWWDTTAPAKLQSKVQPIHEKHQEDGIPLDPLECTQFDDLIELITAETSEWSESRGLTVSDLAELLLDCESLEEVRAKLINKTKKNVFWDVFAQYFEDKKQWEKLKKSINYVINERHKVMHHRPIRFGAIKALQAKKQEIFALLDGAKPELSETERIEAKQDIQEAWKRSAGAVLEAAQSSLRLRLRRLGEQVAQMSPLLGEQFAQISPLLKILSEQAAQPSPLLKMLSDQAAQPSPLLKMLSDQAAQPQEKDPNSDIYNEDDSKH